MMRFISTMSGVGRTWVGVRRLRATILGIVEAQDEMRQEREGVLMYARKR